MPENILVNHPEDGIGLIQINRPDRLNALSVPTQAEITEALAAFEADDSVRCVIITGDARAFAAGADIGEMQHATAVDAVQSRRHEHWAAMRDFPKPLIAAVSGWCLGGGCELAMSCDMIVASETAQFGQPEINLAIIPGAGGTQRLTRAVGKAIAMEMVLAGRFLTAQEALTLGLINSIHPIELYFEKAMELARVVASKAPIAVRLGKDAVQKSFDTTLQEGLVVERRNFAFLFGTEDRGEGIAAFLEKRQPEWKGR